MVNKVEIFNHFEDLISLYLKLNDKNRAASFKAAIESLAINLSNKQEISESEIFSFINFPRVGKSTITEIQEFCKVGNLTKRRIKLEKDIEDFKNNENVESIDLEALESLNSILEKLTENK